MSQDRLTKVELCMEGLKVEMKEVARRLDSNDEAHLRIESKVDAIPDKVSDLIRQKANQKDLDDLSKRFWWILGIVITAIIGIIIYVAQKGIEHLIGG